MSQFRVSGRRSRRRKRQLAKLSLFSAMSRYRSRPDPAAGISLPTRGRERIYRKPDTGESASVSSVPTGTASMASPALRPLRGVCRSRWAGDRLVCLTVNDEG
jgi:hypothetical protein